MEGLFHAESGNGGCCLHHAQRLEQGFQLGRLRSRRRNHPPSSCVCLPSSTQLLLTAYFPLDLIVNCLSFFAQRPIVSTSWPLVLSFEKVLSP